MFENLCMGCMEDKGAEDVCPFCGYAESAPRIHTCLPPRTMIGGRYLVGRVLSYNGEGVSYLGYDSISRSKIEVREYFPDTLAARGEDGQTVTAKPGCQIPFKANMSDFVELMQRLSRLRSLSCLCQVLGLEEQNGTFYAVLEHPEGGTLQEYLDRWGMMMTWDETAEMLMPVMKTLELLHEAGIIHRGISAETIYRTKDGLLKLGGFGISAVRASRTELAAELFPGFSAPEQYSAVSPHGPWTDVYGMSALLYTCVTGSCPPEALIRSAAKELPPPRELNETVPPRVSLAILQGLSLQPENRIQSLGDLAARVSGGESGESPTISMPAARQTSSEKQPAVRPQPPKKAVRAEQDREGHERRSPEKRSSEEHGPKGHRPEDRSPKEHRPVVSAHPRVVQGTSDRRLLITSMLVTLPILLLILIFTFWYLFGNKRQNGANSSDPLDTSLPVAASSSQSSAAPWDDWGGGSLPEFSLPEESSEPAESSELEESSELDDGLVPMVNLVGQQYDDAVKNPAFLVVCTLEEPEYIYSEVSAAGIILWQSVAADTPIEPGSPVRIKVSKGSQYVRIPSYEKRLQEEYLAELDSLGILYAVEYRSGSAYPAGYVVGLSQMEDTKYDLENKSVLTVYVSDK